MSERCSYSWKKWAANYEYEELKEGAWLEPGPPLLRKKVKEIWTEKHRNVARKIFLEGGWTQKRLFDVGWSGVTQCQACQVEEGTEKHRLYHCPEWHAVRRGIPEAFRKLEQKARTSKKEWKWQRGIVVHPLPAGIWAVQKQDDTIRVDGTSPRGQRHEDVKESDKGVLQSAARSSIKPSRRAGCSVS